MARCEGGGGSLCFRMLHWSLQLLMEWGGCCSCRWVWQVGWEVAAAAGARQVGWEGCRLLRIYLV